MIEIDPYKITKDDLPLIVLSDLSSGFIEWAIKWRTNSSWNHIMMMIKPGEVQSQGNTFSSVSISRYMRKNGRLKFWQIKDLTTEERLTITTRVNDRLKLPWWRRTYDYIGIIGQLTGVKWINNPFKPYCSEQVRDMLEGIIQLPLHPSPEECNTAFEKNSRMRMFGRWSLD